MKAHLEVINRPLTYGTRRMLPGEDFLARKIDAIILIRGRRARELRPLAALPPVPEDLLDLAAARPLMVEKPRRAPRRKAAAVPDPAPAIPADADEADETGIAS